MKKLTSIRIVTDSTADIPQSVRQELGIEMVPLKVNIDGETYLDNVTLHPDQFYQMLPRATVLPKTSQPSPADFLDTYHRILTEDPDTHILSIHLSSRFSGTYQSATIARSMLEDETKVTVLDSKTVTYGEGVLVTTAAEMARNGSDLESILEKLAEIRRNTQVYFLVDTLEYLQKGGRIGKASAILGSLLNIKPILSIDNDGEVFSLDKVRGNKRAVARILELMKQEFAGEPVKVMVEYTDSQLPADQIAGLIHGNMNVSSMDYTWIGPVIGTHVGPGTLGVIVTRV
ncbi:DegV family protein [Paenibacillus gansuensis]|uniref:DegV family protein n=1 Tax=Paenibacillus gansuensis TaxID=306542 RepID=A0ABW5PEN1_9BACL